MNSLKQIISNNSRIAGIVNDLQQKLAKAEADYTEVRKQELIKENAKLQKLIEITKQELIDLEIKHNKRQISLPTRNGISNSQLDGDSIATMTVNAQNAVLAKAVKLKAEEQSVTVTSNPESTKVTKSKPKTPKDCASKSNAAAPASDIPVDVRRLDMRIGRITEVSRHPDADSLYLEKIDCGEPTLRTVISGLVKFVPIEQMEKRLVVVLCNLKPVKMRGITSEAMVMCASTPEHVEVLSPPANAQPGELVYCEGYPRQPDALLNPKKKIFESCAPDLKTNEECIACYKGASLYVPDKGHISAATLKNAPVK